MKHGASKPAAQSTGRGAGPGGGAGDGGAAAHAGEPAAGEPAECRHAVAVDADIKERNLKRLRRIEGQVRGLQRMVEEERYCADILTQISSVHEALRGVGRELMRNHLKHCAAQSFEHGGAEADGMYDELIDLIFKHVR